jgi:hypothetical protein
VAAYYVLGLVLSETADAAQSVLLSGWEWPWVRRKPSRRSQRDDQLKVEIARVHRENFGVYRIEKVWHQLQREGVSAGRDRVAA